MIFLLAIIPFGKIDAIGHSAIIASLFMMALRGTSRINGWFSNLHANVYMNAAYAALIYIAALVVFFVLYYSIRVIWLSLAGH